MARRSVSLKMIRNSQIWSNPVVELVLGMEIRNPRCYPWLCHLLHNIGKLSSNLHFNCFICKTEDLDKTVSKFLSVVMFMDLWILLALAKKVVIWIRDTDKNMFLIKNVLRGPQTLTWNISRLTSSIYISRGSGMTSPQFSCQRLPVNFSVSDPAWRKTILYGGSWGPKGWQPLNGQDCHLWPVLREFARKTPMPTNWINVWKLHCIRGRQSVEWNARRDEPNWLTGICEA